MWGSTLISRAVMDLTFRDSFVSGVTPHCIHIRACVPRMTASTASVGSQLPLEGVSSAGDALMDLDYPVKNESRVIGGAILEAARRRIENGCSLL